MNWSENDGINDASEFGFGIWRKGTRQRPGSKPGKINHASLGAHGRGLTRLAKLDASFASPRPHHDFEIGGCWAGRDPASRAGPARENTLASRLAITRQQMDTTKTDAANSPVRHFFGKKGRAAAARPSPGRRALTQLVASRAPVPVMPG